MARGHQVNERLCPKRENILGETVGIKWNNFERKWHIYVPSLEIVVALTSESHMFESIKVKAKKESRKNRLWYMSSIQMLQEHI
jgi:hypothetical protein